jgi:cytochrome oxidase Cu insertion factor (SCO1/SenC/PrrC family)
MMLIKNKAIAILLLATINSAFLANAQIKPGTVYLAGHFDAGTAHSDSVKINVWNDVFSLSKRYFTPLRSYQCLVKNGYFHFKIDALPAGSYFSLADLRDALGNPAELLSLYLVEPGDHVLINIKHRNITNPRKIPAANGDSSCLNCNVIVFSGKGSEKYTCRYAMDEAQHKATKKYMAMEFKQYEQRAPNATKPTLTEESAKRQREIDYVEKRQFAVLTRFKAKLTPVSYQILKANVIGEHYEGYAASMALISSFKNASGLDNYKKLYRARYMHAHQFSDATALKSVYYLNFLIARSKLENSLYHLAFPPGLSNFQKNTIKRESNYHYLESKYKGLLREKLLLTYLIDNISFLSDSTMLLESGSRTMQNEHYREILNELKLNKQIGRNAYNFSLPDSTGKHVTLESFKGKVVFIDFWFTGCKACTEYYTNAVSKVEADFRNNDQVVFISISLDEIRKTWLKAVYGQLYTSPDVINLYKAGSSPITKQFSVDACPHPLLIDKNGKIFSNSSVELRAKGVAGLRNKINQALALN